MRLVYASSWIGAQQSRGPVERAVVSSNGWACECGGSVRRGRRWDAGIAIGIVGEGAWEFRACFQGVGSSRLGRGGELWCMMGAGIIGTICILCSLRWFVFVFY